MAGTMVALLHGINVGRAKRVAMADLRAMMSDLGFGDVRTLLNSGNAVFISPDLSPPDVATTLERALASRLGVTARITILSADELATVVEANPLLSVAGDPSRHLVAFLTDPADRPRLDPLATRDWEPEVLALGERVAYLWCPEGLLASRLPEEIMRTLGKAATIRNWATVMKLRALAAGR
jgi:uncharacterized protein (DUF1697 family)